MILLRSSLYYVVLVFSVLVYGLLIALVGRISSQPFIDRMGLRWGRANLWLQRVICGLHYEIEGAEHLPRGPAIVMSKHQSAWETIALRDILPAKQSWVLKRELLWIPVFGWALMAAKNIAIDRRAGRKAAKQIIAQGRQRLAAGYCVIVFPEGTRTAPGTRRKYGIGGGLLAEQAQVPVVPIAHNAGVFWPRRQLRKYPGTIQVVIGPAIDPAGQSAAQITRAVEDWIERQQTRLPQSLQDVVPSPDSNHG